MASFTEELYSYLGQTTERAKRGNGADGPTPASLTPPDLDAFLEMAFPPQSTLMGPFKRQTIAICAAQTGIGKTHLAVAIAVHLVCGRDLFHWHTPTAAPVLFVDGEMPGASLQERFRQYRLPEQRELLRVYNAMSWGAAQGLGPPNLAEPVWQDAVSAWAKDCEVVVCDNVMSLLSVPKVSLSSDEFWKPAHDFGLRMRSEGRTLIWLDHANDANRVFGTKTKLWAADLVLSLLPKEEHEPRDGCEFVVEFTKTRGLHGEDVAGFEAKLCHGPAGATWSTRFSAEVEVMRAARLQADGLSQRQIAAQMGLSVGKVNRLLQESRTGEAVA